VTRQAIVGAGTAIVAFCILCLLVYLTAFLRAPYQQRDEVRRLVHDYRDRRMFIDRAYIVGETIYVLVRNEGPTDIFTAQALRVHDLVENEWLHAPWPLKWKDSDLPELQIMHGAESVLQICRIFPPQSNPTLEKQFRDTGCVLHMFVAGQERVLTLSGREMAFEEALQTRPAIEVGINGGLLRQPSRAIVQISFPSRQKSRYGGPTTMSLEGTIEVSIRQPSAPTDDRRTETLRH
jgi:hypothetical protein